MPKPRRLTEEQERDLWERYQTFRANRPRNLARDFDLPMRTLNGYLERLRAMHWNTPS